MKYITTLLVTVALAATAAAGTSIIEGDIKLTYSQSAFDKSAFKREFGGAVKATCNWRTGDFFGKETVFAGITVTNTSSAPMFFQYYVAFYDKDKKLVGAAGQGSFGDKGLAPGESTQMGSCLIHLPKDRYKEIASYQAIIYETNTPPNKE